MMCGFGVSPSPKPLALGLITLDPAPTFLGVLRSPAVGFWALWPFFLEDSDFHLAL